MDLKQGEYDTCSAHVEMQQGNLQDSDVTVENSMLHIHSTESKKILRKVDIRVIPILAILYFLSFLDRGNSFLYLWSALTII